MVALVAVSRWNRTSVAALRFACGLCTDDIRVLHINDIGEQCIAQGGELDGDRQPPQDWQSVLSAAAAEAGLPAPRYVAISSPFRFVTEPVLQYALQVQRERPEATVAVVVPELVAERWYQYLLHNHRATALKARLLLEGNRRIVVINVPWYLSGQASAARPQTT